jgi:hypothetical protein
MKSIKPSITVSVAALAFAATWASAGVAAADPTTAPAGPKNSIDADGTYKVGVDIVPGVYSSAGPTQGGACYWKRTAGDKMADNGLTKKSPVVVIDPTDTTFTTHDCQSWKLTDCSQVTCPPPPGAVPNLGPLMSILGSQINPGAQSGPPPSSSAAPAPGPTGTGPAPGPTG